MSQNKKKYIKEAPKYKLAPKQKKKVPLSPCTICIPPFCDELPKGNHDSSSKGGGGVDCRALAKSACKT